jgi:uncharacterized protein YaeQ
MPSRSASSEVDELAAETRLLAGVVDAALRLVRGAGLAHSFEPGRWQRSRAGVEPWIMNRE